jgi:ubiquinone/menaquinone biosynthesis C-methylase UbiE
VRTQDQYSIDVAGPGVSHARALDIHVLDQVQHWGWDEMLFVECGDGWVAEEAWRRRRTRGHVVAVDMSCGAIERARELRGVAGQVEFGTWNGYRLYQDDGKFDQIISRFALQRSSDPAALAREMLRVLRPQGELYALEPTSNADAVRQFLLMAGFSAVEVLPPCDDEGTPDAATDGAAVIHAHAIVDDR